MSGYLAGSKQFKLSSAGKTTPVLHCHGTADPMVTFSMAQKTESLLKESGGEMSEMSLLYSTSLLSTPPPFLTP